MFQCVNTLTCSIKCISWKLLGEWHKTNLLDLEESDEWQLTSAFVTSLATCLFLIPSSSYKLAWFDFFKNLSIIQQSKCSKSFWEHISVLMVGKKTQMLTRKPYLISLLSHHCLASVVSVNLTPSLNETGWILRVCTNLVISIDMSAGDFTPRSTWKIDKNAYMSIKHNKGKRR